MNDRHTLSNSSALYILYIYYYPNHLLVLSVISRDDYLMRLGIRSPCDCPWIIILGISHNVPIKQRCSHVASMIFTLYHYDIMIHHFIQPCISHYIILNPKNIDRKIKHYVSAPKTMCIAFLPLQLYCST